MATTETRRYRGYDIVPRRQWAQWCVSVYPTRADLPILSRSTLRSLTPRKEEAVKEARQRIDRVLSSSQVEGAGPRFLWSFGLGAAGAVQGGQQARAFQPKEPTAAPSHIRNDCLSARLSVRRAGSAIGAPHANFAPRPLAIRRHRFRDEWRPCSTNRTGVRPVEAGRGSFGRGGHASSHRPVGGLTRLLGRSAAGSDGGPPSGAG